MNIYHYRLEFENGHYYDGWFRNKPHAKKVAELNWPGQKYRLIDRSVEG